MRLPILPTSSPVDLSAKIALGTMLPHYISQQRRLITAICSLLSRFGQQNAENASGYIAE